MRFASILWETRHFPPFERSHSTGYEHSLRLHLLADYQSRRHVIPYPKHLHYLIAEVVDDFDGDAAAWDRISKPQSFMFLRHTRENENGAGALITVRVDQQSFKTTDCTEFTQISTDGSWKSARCRANLRR